MPPYVLCNCELGDSGCDEGAIWSFVVFLRVSSYEYYECVICKFNWIGVFRFVIPVYNSRERLSFVFNVFSRTFDEVVSLSALIWHTMWLQYTIKGTLSDPNNLTNDVIISLVEFFETRISYI